MATFDEVELAFMFVSAGAPFEHTAYISRSTGQTFVSSEFGGESDVPEDVLENTDYVEIPHRYDLDLGKELVWRFVELEIPALRRKVESLIRGRGGWGRYKAFLDELGILGRWHEFENSETQEALRRWCRDAGIPLED